MVDDQSDPAVTHGDPPPAVIERAGADLELLGSSASGSQPAKPSLAHDNDTKGEEPTSLWTEFRSIFSERARVICAVLADGLLLVIVGSVNYGVAWAVSRMHLEGIDNSVITLLQWVFGVSTIGAVMAYVLRDLIVACARAVRGER